MHKAFWDVLQAQLDESPPVYQHALVLLCEIKEVRDRGEFLDSIDVNMNYLITVPTEPVSVASFAKALSGFPFRICISGIYDFF